jgi:hypothetical protein
MTSTTSTMKINQPLNPNSLSAQLALSPNNSHSQSHNPSNLLLIIKKKKKKKNLNLLYQLSSKYRERLRESVI